MIEPIVVKESLGDERFGCCASLARFHGTIPSLNISTSIRPDLVNTTLRQWLIMLDFVLTSAIFII